MLRSMYSGIGGLRGFQTKLDVIGNNIANVNTTGFKKSRVEFQDILSQTMSGGSAPGDLGGTNPKQVGLGSAIAAIDVIHTQGGFMTTSVPTDLAIEGNGFFMVKDATDQVFVTRAGNFSFDRDGNLVNSNGLFVLDSGGAKVTLGTTMDKIKSYSIGADGKITYTDDAGKTDTTTTGVGIAMVENPAGLEKVGANLYKLTASATEDPAAPKWGEANKEARGAIRAGILEMSNVDLSEEFTEMIVAQRGFQANSRIITTSDSILEELVNLKR
ncbi:flagellar basal body rod protein FlgG [Aneurinibacillus uraniidurans]|uniref:flagellar basal body rod protein FlgG n=1 Tax=Aneurinibacillus uraniidurans TaxID=2966586 RepID=UPI00234929AF|nr:flagellar basal body rod protein FlgG [Aneurinibacillus sp. B1]WCN39099.1 flagellar basal body rod protein FlgG [Aneurinibacillus sp. B1]